MPLAGAIPFTTGNASLVFYWPTGVAIDFTIDIAAPQVELGTVATPFIATSSGEVTHGDGAVNYLLHTDMSGAVAGTRARCRRDGGSAGRWRLATGRGRRHRCGDRAQVHRSAAVRHHRQHVIDRPGLRQSNAIDATTGQAWCPSVYAQFTRDHGPARPSSWACSNSTALARCCGRRRDPSALSVNVVSRSDASRHSQYADDHAICAAVSVFFYASGVALNVTIRIMAPQFEGGAVASAFIPTTTTPASRPATYTMTGLPVSLNEPDATNYVRTGSPGVRNVRWRPDRVPTIFSASPLWKHFRTATGTDSNTGAIW